GERRRSPPFPKERRGMAKSTAELGIDPERLLIAGVSGGGGLAAGTALLARDRGFPRLSHQVLDLRAGRAVYGGPDVSPYAAPARAQDLSLHMWGGAVHGFDMPVDQAAVPRE
ncbi:MAG: alpha/beta hydrolase fold domain-containing protein, partial [Nonomuraea sp.]|nr:alpha/beta hydrolase fold domain-containing protein [Nonomuraea sp.]